MCGGKIFVDLFYTIQTFNKYDMKIHMKNYKVDNTIGFFGRSETQK